MTSAGTAGERDRERSRPDEREESRGAGGPGAEGGDEDERRHRQEMLDEALADTFPASDPPAVRPNKPAPDPEESATESGA